jgi:predicted amidohydrolase
MKTKVAAVSISNEKEWDGDTLRYHYSNPDMSEAEAMAVGDLYHQFVDDLVNKAADDGAKIICLPEHTIEVHQWLRTVSDEKRKFELVHANWDRLKAHLSDLAKARGVVLVAGTYEPEEDRMYNAAAVVDADGSYLGSYRKVQLADGEDRILARGDSLPVFSTAYGRVGVFICWDIMYPEITQTLMLNGAQILLQPTYGHAGHMADPMAQTRAHDAVCPLVVSMWNGNSRVFDCDGRMLARAHRTRDWHNLIPHQITSAEVDIGAPRDWIVHADLQQYFKESRQWKTFGPMAGPPESPPESG